MDISILKLDQESEKLLQTAIAYSGIPLDEFIRRACIIHSKVVIGRHSNRTKDLAEIHTDELLKNPSYKTHPMRPGELALRAIQAIENYNDSCTEKSQKWMITMTSIRALTGSDPSSIKSIFFSLESRIDAHNRKHGLSHYDNRKPGLKIKDAIDLAKSMPYGVE